MDNVEAMYHIYIKHYPVVILVDIFCVSNTVCDSINYITCFCDWQILAYRKKTGSYHIMGEELANSIYLKVFVEQ